MYTIIVELYMRPTLMWLFFVIIKTCYDLLSDLETDHFLSTFSNTSSNKEEERKSARGRKIAQERGLNNR